MDLDDSDLPLADPAESLRVIREQQAEAIRRLNPDQRLYYWPWGLAWLIGFGLLFLRFGPDGRVFVNLPTWLPLTVLFVLLAAAGTVTAVAGRKAYGQITGDSSRRGSWYGLAWFLGNAGIIVTLSRVSGSLPEHQAGLLWAASAVGLTGTLHLAGGAIWLDRTLFNLGVWVSLINIVGVLAGVGWHSLVISVAGGGGMLLVGELAGRRRHA